MIQNDCAISKRPKLRSQSKSEEAEEYEWLLLQTMPSLNFVDRSKITPYSERWRYFSGLLDQEFSSRLSESVIVMDTANSWRTQKALMIIRHEEIVEVVSESIGAGGRGEVYKAVWNCPKLTDMTEPQRIDVALKSVKTEEILWKEVSRFFTFTPEPKSRLTRNQVLANLNVPDREGNGVRFLGLLVTPMPVPGSQVLSSTHDSISTGDIYSLPAPYFMVFELAKTGDLGSYLNRELNGNPLDDWHTISDIAFEISYNLYNLHDAWLTHG